VSIRNLKTLAAAGIVVVMVPMSARSSDGTITFTGAVTESSCTVRVNGAGTGDGTVALPVVNTAALDHSAPSKDSAAGTFFDITLSGCIAGQTGAGGNAPGQVAIYFEAGPTVNVATSALINAGTSNVEVKLYQASDATIAGSPITPGTATGQPASQPIAGTSTQHFYAGYSLTHAAATPGSVITSVTYSLVYQ
jgi:major type 1 subunit fimbrin (pilin)